MSEIKLEQAYCISVIHSCTFKSSRCNIHASDQIVHHPTRIPILANGLFPAHFCTFNRVASLIFTPPTCIHSIHSKKKAMVAYEMKSSTSVTSRGGGQVERDNAHLQRMGKKPVLKVCNA